MRVTANSGTHTRPASPFHHFSTGMVPGVDTMQTRLHITTPVANFKEAYIFCDGNKVLYDMAGRAIWYLPLIEGRDIPPRDLKLSGHGTITFLEANAYELDYDGNILWKAPNDGQISGQSHEY